MTRDLCLCGALVLRGDVVLDLPAVPDGPYFANGSRRDPVSVRISTRYRTPVGYHPHHCPEDQT